MPLCAIEVRQALVNHSNNLCTSQIAKKTQRVCGARVQYQWIHARSCRRPTFVATHRIKSRTRTKNIEQKLKNMKTTPLPHKCDVCVCVKSWCCITEFICNASPSITTNDGGCYPTNYHTRWAPTQFCSMQQHSAFKTTRICHCATKHCTKGNESFKYDYIYFAGKRNLDKCCPVESVPFQPTHKHVYTVLFVFKWIFIWYLFCNGM